MFEIEKNMSMPQALNTQFVEIFAKMEVGDSFKIENKKRNSYNAAVASFKKINIGKKFCIKKETDTQLRVFRIK
jgi:hypothetical protein